MREDKKKPLSPDTIELVLVVDKHDLAVLMDALVDCQGLEDLRSQVVVARRQLHNQQVEAVCQTVPEAMRPTVRRDLRLHEDICDAPACPLCEFVLDPNGECVNARCPNWIKV